MRTSKEKFEMAMIDLNEELKKYKKNFVYAAAYGSDNYNIQTPMSDIDIKVIVVPTLHDIVSNSKPVSEVWNFEWGQADIKDIRLMVENFYKQNTNFLETLFTPYHLTNPHYKDEVERLLAAREQIVRIDELRHIRATRGMQEQKYVALKRRFPSKVEIIDKYGYDPKQLSHIIRLYDLTTKYVEGKDYLNCITPTGSLKDTIIDVKIGKLLYTPEEAEEIARNYMAKTEILYQSYKNSYNIGEAMINEYNGKKVLEDFKYQVIKKALEEELKNEN